MKKPAQSQPDADLDKGTVEDTSPGSTERPGEEHDRLAGQLSHRETDDQIKGNDSDFPEPGASPEHT